MNCHSLIILHIYLTFYFTYSFLHPCKEVHCIKFMSLMHYLQESNDRVFMTAICLFENFIYLHNVPSSYLLPTSSLQLPHILLNFIVCLFWKRNSLSPIKVCGYLNNMKSVENIVQVTTAPVHLCVSQPNHVLGTECHNKKLSIILHRCLLINVHWNFIHGI